MKCRTAYFGLTLSKVEFWKFFHIGEKENWKRKERKDEKDEKNFDYGEYDALLDGFISSHFVYNCSLLLIYSVPSTDPI